MSIFTFFWRFKWLMILMMALGGAAAYFYAKSSSKIYRSTSTVVLVQSGDQPSSSLAGFASIAGLDVGSGADLGAEAIAVLGSRSFLVRFAHEHGLVGRGLFRGYAEGKTDNYLYERFSGALSVAEDQKAKTITVRLDGPDREVGAEVVNELVDDINAHMKNQAIDQANSQLKYLQRELAATSVVGVREVIFRLMEGHIKTIALANAKQEYVFKVIDPAVASDESGQIFPRLKLLIVLGIAFGIFVASFIGGIVVMRDAHKGSE